MVSLKLQQQQHQSFRALILNAFGQSLVQIFIAVGNSNGNSVDGEFRHYVVSLLHPNFNFKFSLN